VLPLESVPNFSEGRDSATIAAIGDALGAKARLLDVHADEDHNRSVFTLVGTESELADALVAGIRVASERIDLRKHEGAHPRIGAADVVPIVPLRPEDLERARDAASRHSTPLGAAIAVLQVAIAIASVCLITKKKVLWAASGVFGAVGTGFLVYGLWLV
jgi:glutamate formiminotransferase